MIILFGGGMGAGKDTMREMLIEKRNLQKEFHFSFAAPLKDEANAIMEALSKGVSFQSIAENFGVEMDEVKTASEILGDSVFKYPEIHSRTRTPEVRKFLQYWGTDVRRKKDVNYWVNLAKKIITEYTEKGYDVIITDGRFSNEFDLVNSLGGKTICLAVSEEERIKRIENRDGITPSRDALDHSSEKDWKTYVCFSGKIDSDALSEEETLDKVLELI